MVHLERSAKRNRYNMITRTLRRKLCSNLEQFQGTGSISGSSSEQNRKWDDPFLFHAVPKQVHIVPRCTTKEFFMRYLGKKWNNIVEQPHPVLVLGTISSRLISSTMEHRAGVLSEMSPLLLQNRALNNAQQ